LVSTLPLRNGGVEHFDSQKFYAVPPSKEKLAAITKVLGDSKLVLNTVWLLMKPTTWTQPTVDTGRHVPMVMSSASASMEVQDSVEK